MCSSSLRGVEPLFEEMNATGWIEEARRAHTETLAREK
jgi:hypothetical protein